MLGQLPRQLHLQAKHVAVVLATWDQGHILLNRKNRHDIERKKWLWCVMTLQPRDAAERKHCFWMVLRAEMLRRSVRGKKSFSIGKSGDVVSQILYGFLVGDPTGVFKV